MKLYPFFLLNKLDVINKTVPAGARFSYTCLRSVGPGVLAVHLRQTSVQLCQPACSAQVFKLAHASRPFRMEQIHRNYFMNS